ncbi:MAG: NUDIX domain-containing protein [Catalinimonas sp.]
MKIFVRNKPVHLVKPHQLEPGTYTDLSDDARPLTPDRLQGDLLWHDPTDDQLTMVFDLLKTHPAEALRSVTLAAEKRKALRKAIKRRFRIVRAAGGVVSRDDRFLMIYRLKRWDLPKGKLEAGEKFSAAAVREVEEECSVSVARGPKICTTWHTYENHGKNVLKQTRWYAMTCLRDDEMRPQQEEGIEDLRWMKRSELDAILAGSYLSIREVFDRYFEQTPA